MSAEAALKLVDTTSVESKSLTLVDQAKAIVVIDADTYIKAGEMWKQIAAMKKEVEEAFDKNIKRWHEGHKSALADKARYYDPLDQAAKGIKKLMSDYDQEQERIRLEEQRRLEEEARKAEEERRLQEAIMAEEEAKASGATKEEAEQEAAAILEEPVTVAPVIVPKATPKLQGGPVYREVWSARVTDIRALCRAVAEGRASTECVMGNMPVLNKMATALKNTMQIPGVAAESRRV